MIRNETRIDGVLVSLLEDFEDGTGVLTTYDTGVPVVTTVSGLPVTNSLDAAVEAARASLAAATTVAQVRARTVALFDLLNT